MSAAAQAASATWESDTPRESQRASVHGASGAVGLSARAAPRTSLVVRAGYRRVRSSGDRWGRAIGLTGPTLDAGLHLWL